MTQPSEPTLEEELPTSTQRVDYDALLKNVFSVQGGEVYMGNDKLTPEVRSLMRDEAVYIQNSELWRMLSASLINEAVGMALFQSQEWEHVLAAKQLHHYAHFVRNVIHMLSK